MFKSKKKDLAAALKIPGPEPDFRKLVSTDDVIQLFDALVDLPRYATDHPSNVLKIAIDVATAMHKELWETKNAPPRS